MLLSDLITSKTRVKILALFLDNPNDMFHVREVVRRVDEEINAVRRELLFLEKKGVLTKEPRANRVYYYFSKTYPFYFDLLKIGVKTIGLGADILSNRAKLGKIKYAMFSGKFARRMKVEPDEISLLIVGTVVLPELTLLIRTEEKRLNTEINYTVMSEEEFDFRKKRRDPFILSILSASRIMLLGDEESMLE